MFTHRDKGVGNRVKVMRSIQKGNVESQGCCCDVLA